MIAHLWPEGMMPYTVVGLENSGLSTNSGPDLIFATSDGYITVGTISDSEWQGFCAAVEQPQLASDERFSTAELRSRNAIERITLMGTLLKAYSSVEALARLDAADVPCAPVLRRKDILDNEQVVAMRLIGELEQPTVGRVRQPRPAARFDDTALGEARPAPRIGQHSGEILAGLGFDQDSIEGLKNQKVVRLPT
jgi:crotonobetainyl-CoA:carnitine CoA-transferase CaiB-like acyl-CoA transferase